MNNRIALSTSCLGLHPTHALDDKLRAAAKHSFQGIEIVYGDLEVYARNHTVSISEAAKRIQRLCASLHLHVLALVPFENFEGAKAPLEERIQKAKHWIGLARLLGAEHIQVPAQFGKDVVKDEDVIVSELQQLCDLAATASSDISEIKIAYEPMSWSTCYSTWQSALHLAKKVGRKNFGVCMDTFHIASKMYGDNSARDGMYPHGQLNLQQDLQQFMKDFPLEKLFYVQLSDGARFAPPWSSSHPWYEEGVDKEFCWSKFGRPFPLESDYGGYFPVVEMVRAWVVEKRFEGWVSFETFDWRMREEGFDVETGAERAVRSLERMKAGLKGVKAHL